MKTKDAWKYEGPGEVLRFKPRQKFVLGAVEPVSCAYRDVAPVLDKNGALKRAMWRAYRRRLRTLNG